MRILGALCCILRQQKNLWKDLEERFGQSNKARLFQVQKDVTRFSQGDMDMANYGTKARQFGISPILLV